MKTRTKKLLSVALGLGALVGLPSSALAVPDVTFCQLYGLGQHGKLGDIRGLALATTSWNIGTTNLTWRQSPDNRHPFIAMNLYRLDNTNDRFLHVGQSWLKHGFFALSNTQCGGSCSGTNGTALGVGCTDTYGAGLNGQQSGLGPRFEVNPWTGGWSYSGSMFQTGGPTNTPITRRLQVHVDDLAAPNSSHFAESYYVHFEDTSVMNNTAWKPVTPNPLSNDNWGFTMTNQFVFPNIGFAIDAWAGAMQTVVAEQIPVIEHVSPDGRCILAAKAIDLGNGRYRYEYAILNIDMDRQVGSFSVPISSAMNVGSAGFHAVFHHDEPWNTVAADKIAINNNAWTPVISADSITWSTTANPLRWGTLYNFWFEADAEPMTGPTTLGLFRAAPAPRPTELTGDTVVPTFPPVGCEGDADGDGKVNLDDITYIVLRLGTPGPDGDVDSSGLVDLDDITYTVLRLGTCN